MLGVQIELLPSVDRCQWTIILSTMDYQLWASIQS